MLGSQGLRSEGYVKTYLNDVTYVHDDADLTI